MPKPPDLAPPIAAAVTARARASPPTVPRGPVPR